MITSVLMMFGATFLQNASFTLVSRARNSKSLVYHGLASMASNGVWLLVIRQVVTNLNNWILMATYFVAATVGSVTMHWVSMRFLEKKVRS